MNPCGNYCVVTDTDGNHRAIVYQKIRVEKDEDNTETPYMLLGMVGNAVNIIKKFKDQKASNRKLLWRCGVDE